MRKANKLSVITRRWIRRAKTKDVFTKPWQKKKNKKRQKSPTTYQELIRLCKEERRRASKRGDRPFKEVKNSFTFGL